ncbi:ankyrin repeat domain-containing protein 54-like [Uranotaenia lowii]|uniref:ankyrin repeat domain-containing protein 54-like n=1 Tax=Uranotaenia lowii TaxID=190385 RepID=UPI00247B13B3|nr:ankyrin repeat domain-containing protein 54-like [Uranotaenia lowii]
MSSEINPPEPNPDEEVDTVPEAEPSPPRLDENDGNKEEIHWQQAIQVAKNFESNCSSRMVEDPVGAFSGGLKMRLQLRTRMSPYLASRPRSAMVSQFLNAAMTNNTELLREMIEKGFSPDTREPTFNRSALHVACSRGFTDSVRLLLEAGANPNIRDLNENTPLHLASCTENFAIIDLLLKYGTNATLKDANGLMALEIAIGKLRLSDRIISKMQKLTKSDIHTHRNNVVKVCEMIFKVFKAQVRSGSLLYLDPSQAGHMHQRHLEEMLEEFDQQLGKIKDRGIDFDSIVDQVENLNLRTEIDSDVNSLLSTLQKLSV